MEVVRARLRGGFVSGEQIAQDVEEVRRLQNQINSLDKTIRIATNSGRKFNSGLRQVRSGMSQAAIIALGTKSAFGQIGQGLLLLGPGEGAIIAAAAGLAAVGFALSKLKDRAKESAKEFKEMVDGLVEDSKRLQEDAAERLAGGALQLRRVRLEATLARLATERLIIIGQINKKLRESGSIIKENVAGGENLKQILSFADDEQKTRLDELKREAKDARKALDELTIQIQESGDKSLTAAQKYALFVKAIKAFAAEMIRQRRAAAELEASLITAEQALQKQIIGLQRGAAAARRFTFDLQQLARAQAGASPERLAELEAAFVFKEQLLAIKDIGKIGLESLEEFFKDLKDQAKARKAKFQQIGERIGRDLVRGLVNAIFEGTITVGEALKRMLLAAAVSALGQFIGGAIGGVLSRVFSRGGTPAAGAAGGSHGFGASLGRLPSTAGLTAASGPTLAFNVSAIPANINPISAARDRQWLALVSETQRVAPSLGIRMVLQ
jgi:hypothetical protein